MTTYTPITDAETAAQSPLTVSKERRWRDNPIAITEGATGAPKIQPKALADTYLGIFSWNGAAAFGGVTGLAAIKVVRIHVTVAPSASSLLIQFTADNGATWGGSQTTLLVGSSGIVPGVPLLFDINLDTGAYRGITTAGGTSPQMGIASGTLTVPANCNGLRMSWNATGIYAGYAYAVAGR